MEGLPVHDTECRRDQRPGTFARLNRTVAGFIAATLVAGVAGCATLQRFAALKAVDFDLAGVRHARLAGVDVTRIAAYRDLGPVDVGRIALAVSRGDIPLEFQLDVRADNPADNGTAALTRLAWTLLLDGRETISGVIDTTVTLPAGQVTIIPVPMRVNLRQFFDGPAQSLVDLAASAAGLRADPTKVQLRAVPTIHTPLGPITYPGPITVSRTVGGPPGR
jgi:hypothetical protein